MHFSPYILDNTKQQGKRKIHNRFVISIVFASSQFVIFVQFHSVFLENAIAHRLDIKTLKAVKIIKTRSCLKHFKVYVSTGVSVIKLSLTIKHFYEYTQARKHVSFFHSLLLLITLSVLHVALHVDYCSVPKKTHTFTS